MELKQALIGQFRAGLAMLRECVALCPDDLWSATVGKPPRSFWRIAYHVTFYTHYYLTQTRADFKAWDRHVNHAVMTFVDDGGEFPPEGTLYSQSDLLQYIDLLTERMGEIIDTLDLDSPESGFPWFEELSKIDHVLLTLRHLGLHVGQLQELLFSRGLDPAWASVRTP